MPAFSDRQMLGLNRALDQFNTRMYNIYSINLDEMQIINGLLSAEDVAVLQRAQFMGLKSSDYSPSVKFNVPTAPGMAMAHISFNTVSLPIPKQVSAAPHDLHAKWPFAEELSEYVANVAVIAEQFAVARGVLAMLNAECRTPKQVRYFLPAIVPLLKDADMKELADKLAPKPIVPGVPTLLYGTRQPIIDTNALIAKAGMLPERSRPRTNVLVRWSQPFALPWGGSATMMTC